jgi:mxaA protein
MKNILSKIIIALALALFAMTSFAASIYELRIQNPKKQAAYVVGDTFTRTFELDLKAPYKLAQSSIPAKGSAVNGIELSSIKINQKQSSKVNSYKVQLEYQIFTSAATVKKLEVSKYPLKITGAGKSYIITVPAWQFRVSPLATHNETYLEQDMSAYRGPMLVDTDMAKWLLGIFLSITLTATLGLIYINEDGAWFPGMGGPFAMSYRRIMSLEPSGTPNSNGIRDTNDIVLIQQATTNIHHAFNQTYGENLFAADIDHFLEKHPGFASIKHEIIRFFQLSNLILFRPSQPVKTNLAETNHFSMTALANFCEQCRHCERGVV